MLAAKGETVIVGWCCVVGVYGKLEMKSNACGQSKFACSVAMTRDSLRLSSLQINPGLHISHTFSEYMGLFRWIGK